MKTLTLILCTLFSLNSWADDIPDYDGMSTNWNGLSDFVQLGESLGLEMQVTSQVDFDSLTESDVLIFVYPQDEIRANEVSRFVIDGGRVVLADDFGKSEALLTRLEIERLIATQRFLPHKTFHEGNRALPLFKPKGRHPLLTNVKSILANHPALITNVGGPVVSFDEGAGLVYDMNLGEGKVVTIADSSIFINSMLKMMDNKVFAENALRYNCERAIERTQKCRVHLLTKRFEQKGTYRPNQSRNNSLDGFIADFNRVVKESAQDVNKDFLFFFSLMLIIGLGVYLISVLPLIETRNYSKYVTDFAAALPWPQSEFDWNMSRFAANESLQSDILPMAILKEIFEEIFLDELGYWPSATEERPNLNGLCSEFSKRFLQNDSSQGRARIEKKLIELLTVFATTPPRHRVFLENDTEIFKGDLEKYHRSTIEIIKIMGRLNDYEQRKWGSS